MFAMNMQGVCDGNRKFLGVYIDCPGATHDSLAWKCSELHRDLEEYGLPEGLWIAADAAYGCSQQIICPFPGRNLSPRKSSFNFQQSRKRINIECAFGILVRRWGCLWKPLEIKTERVPTLVKTCSKLHNFIYDHEGKSGAHRLPEPEVCD